MHSRSRCSVRALTVSLISSTFAVVATGAAPAAALDGPGRALVVSNQLRAAVNPALTSDSGESVERSFIPPYSGTVRLTWEIRSGDGTDVISHAFVSHLSDCDNGPISSTTFVAQRCDLRVTGGMPVTVRAFPDNGTNTVTLRRVQLHYRVVDSNGKAIVYELPED